MSEILISVDVETAGPSPSQYAMLSIGACLVDAPETGFYVELQPATEAAVPTALAVSGLTMAELAVTGVPAVEAMLRFEGWVAQNVPHPSVPVFVGFNAGFDWMFIADYFERFLGRNPFGHAALDIKSYAMAVGATSWAETSMSILSPRYLGGRILSHNALDDARDQARMFCALRDEATAGR